MLSADLWRTNEDLARACLDHPFVRGIADGTLDEGAFKRYVAQDAFFLRAFARAYALAAARSEAAEIIADFHELLGGVLEELKLHAAYAETLGIDLTGAKPWHSTSAYTDFLLAAAWGGDLSETVAAMTPCMRLYAFLGAELALGGVPDHAYADWIATYSSADFTALAARLERLLDRLAENTPPVRDAYRYAMRCELAFFGAPLEAR